MKELYIFNNRIKRGIMYGIGTYMDQLIKVLKDTEWKLNVVFLNAAGIEPEIIEEAGYRQINIPYPSQHSNAKQYYPKIIAYLLKDIISIDRNTECIFQLNIMNNYSLIRYLKKIFRFKIILVLHYSDWSFSLLGDFLRLQKMINRPKKDEKNIIDEALISSFMDDLKMINSVDHLVCVAQHTLDTYHKSDNFRPRRTTIIHNALEDIYKPLQEKEKINLRKKYLIEENIKIILFAGRLDEVKGIEYLIRAFKKILKIYPDIRLLIAGDGDFFNQLIKESADYWTKISFTGRIEKKKLYELYHVADMGVVCSLHEEFGLVAIEMMMHELPVIVTKTGGLDEIVEDRVSGLKVSVRKLKGKRQVDVKQLEEKMRFLLDNPAYAQELGRNGRKRFLEKFELSIFKEKMLNLYNNL